MPINNNCCVNNTCCKVGLPPDTLQLIFSSVVMCTSCSYFAATGSWIDGFGIDAAKVISGTLDGTYCLTRVSADTATCVYEFTLSSPIIVGLYTTNFSGLDCTALTLTTTVSVNLIRVTLVRGVSQTIEVKGATGEFTMLLFKSTVLSSLINFCDGGTYDNDYHTCGGPAHPETEIDLQRLVGVNGTVTVIPDEC